MAAPAFAQDVDQGSINDDNRDRMHLNVMNEGEDLEFEMDEGDFRFFRADDFGRLPSRMTRTMFNDVRSGLAQRTLNRDRMNTNATGAATTQ